MCHNRVAHNDEAAPPTLTAPNGTKNIKHPNFMTMDACFRCHDLEGKVKMTGQKPASGVCTTCHPAGFELVPESHKAADWSGAAHGERSKEILKEMGALEVEAKVLEEEGIAPYLAAPVNQCFTCHIESKFCAPCHDKLQGRPTDGPVARNGRPRRAVTKARPLTGAGPSAVHRSTLGESLLAAPRDDRVGYDLVGMWLSLVERSVRDREVVGSNPAIPTR